MNKCILRVQGINLYDRLKEEKVLRFKNNHFLRIRTGKGFSLLTTLRMAVYTGYSLVLNFV